MKRPGTPCRAGRARATRAIALLAFVELGGTAHARRDNPLEPGAPLASPSALTPGLADPPTPELTPPAPTPEPALPEPAGAGNASAAEAATLAALQAELSNTAASDVGVNEPRLSLFGFADFTYSTVLGKRFPTATPYPTFGVGNLNLYVSNEINQSWRAMAEVRFLYVPHGTIPIADTFNPAAVRTNTEAPDPADANRTVRWGGIQIERVWLEHTLSELLSVRVGQWLTPYGIWNVDHGSPVIISAARPYIIGEGLFPGRQTGIQAHGTLSSDATQLGYHLTLSNGRGPIDAYQDLDQNKAIGARLFVRNDSLLGTLTLGASGYAGSYTDRPSQTFGVSADGTPIIIDPAIAKYDERSLAADLKWEWEGLLVQSEAILNDRTYAGGVRPADPGFGGPPGFAADARRQGLYALVGYRTPWWNIMPYLDVQYYSNSGSFSSRAATLGVNLRAIPPAVFKLEYTYIAFSAANDFEVQLLQSQVAWSF